MINFQLDCGGLREECGGLPPSVNMLDEALRSDVREGLGFGLWVMPMAIQWTD